MDLELTGKTAVITGGSKGIGKAIARELAREGVTVVIAARGLDALQATAAELSSETNGRVVAMAVDTGDDDAVRALFQRVADEFRRIDILVNNAAAPAGNSPVPAAEEITSELLNADVNIKVMGYLRCIREVVPHMKRQRWGRIVNISGLAARRTGNTIGSIRNVAVVAMTKNLGDELGPHGINVNCIHPGMTRTERTPGMFEARASREGISVAEAEAQMAAGNSVRRVIDAEDIASVVAFLASPKSSAINGDIIAAGGGDPGVIHY